jgi:hypothetical protein
MKKIKWNSSIMLVRDASVHYADEQRDLDLEFHGHTVLRFTNDRVLFDIDTVLAIILTKLKSLPSIGKKPLNHQPRMEQKLIDDAIT